MKKFISILGGYVLCSFAGIGFAYVLKEVRKNVGIDRADVDSIR